MAADPRPFVVLETSGTRRLVDAGSKSQALKHAAKAHIVSVEQASAREVADLLTDGVKIEKAGEA